MCETHDHRFFSNYYQPLNTSYLFRIIVQRASLGQASEGLHLPHGFGEGDDRVSRLLIRGRVRQVAILLQKAELQVYFIKLSFRNRQ